MVKRPLRITAHKSRPRITHFEILVQSVTSGATDQKVPQNNLKFIELHCPVKSVKPFYGPFDDVCSMKPRRRRSVSLRPGFRVEGPKKSQIQNFFKMTSEKEKGRKITKLKFLQKGIYVVALFILILLLLVQTIQCVVKFARGPTYISSEIVPQKEAGFPALTICPESNKYKEDVLLAHGISSEKGYNYKTDLNWTSNQDDVTESDLFHLATRNLSEIVKRVYVRYFKADVRYIYVFCIYG